MKKNTLENSCRRPGNSLPRNHLDEDVRKRALVPLSACWRWEIANRTVSACRSWRATSNVGMTDRCYRQTDETESIRRDFRAAI